MNTQPKQPDQPPENVRSIKFEALLRELKRLVNEHGDLRRLAFVAPGTRAQSVRNVGAHRRAFTGVAERIRPVGPDRLRCQPRFGNVITLSDGWIMRSMKSANLMNASRFSAANSAQ